MVIPGPDNKSYEDADQHWLDTTGIVNMNGTQEETGVSSLAGMPNSEKIKVGDGNYCV